MFRTLCIAVFVALAALPSAAQTKKQIAYGKYVGEAYLAYHSSFCKGVRPIEEDYQQFVFAVAKIAESEGLRNQRVRRHMFYGKQDDLLRVARLALTDRGVKLGDKPGHCRLARKVAGTSDRLGRFLVKD